MKRSRKPIESSPLAKPPKRTREQFLKVLADVRQDWVGRNEAKVLTKTEWGRLAGISEELAADAESLNISFGTEIEGYRWNLPRLQPILSQTSKLQDYYDRIEQAEVEEEEINSVIRRQ